MNQKAITLPSGATCTVTAPNRFVRMAAGQPPATLIAHQKKRAREAAAAQQAGRALPPDDREMEPHELDWILRQQRTQLVRCISPLTVPDSGTVRLVDKPVNDCGPAERSIEALPDADLDAITTALNELEGTVSAASATFPANPSTPGSPEPRRTRKTLQ